QGFDAAKAAALAAEQADVTEVAERIAAGVKNTARVASQMLERAMPAIAEASRELETLQQQPGAAGKPIAVRVSAAAQAAARQLADSAAQLRNQQGLAAEELQKIAGEQLAAAEAARQAVEKAAEPAKESPAAAIA